MSELEECETKREEVLLELKARKSSWLRRWFFRLNVVASVVVLGALITLEFFGESSVFLSLPLYLPAWGWCIPSLLMLPLSAILNWRCIPMHLGVIGVICWFYMDFEYNRPLAKGRDISIVSYNYGQHRGTEFVEFAEMVQADVIVLMEAPGQSPKYQQVFKGMYFAEIDEFVMMSKYEILSVRKAVTNEDTGKVRAAVFTIAHPKQPVSIYAVHLPTPRPQFAGLRSTRVGILPGRRLLERDARDRYLQYVENKARLVRDIMAEVEKESLPCLVVGDFNTPPKGVIYRRITSRLTDCFSARGRGYGYTFPGDAKSWYAFRRPWLRIDYIFCDQSWEVCNFQTETGRSSQHLAVAARLRLKEEWRPGR